MAPPDDQLVVRRALRAFVPDPQHAILAAILTGNATLDQLAVGSDAVNEAFDGRTFENAEVTITGTPTFLTDINDYLQGGMLVLGGIAVLVMMVILLVAFRSAGDCCRCSAWSSESSGGSVPSGSPARSCRSSRSPACRS